MGWWQRCKGVVPVPIGLGIGLPIGLGIGFSGVAVAVAPERIQATYGITADDPDVAVLMRHRGVMLALIGSVLVVSAFRRDLRPVAVPAAGTSMATYALFAFTEGANDPQRRVAVVDVVLLMLLAAATAPLDWREPPRSSRSRAARSSTQLPGSCGHPARRAGDRCPRPHGERRARGT